MSESLQGISISAPGFEGLNKNASAVDLPPQWALQGDNCILDIGSRVACRKGWVQVTTTPLVSTPNIVAMAEYLQKDGTTQIISAAGNNIYSGTTTLTSIYSTAITADYWQMVNFNNYLWLFQRNHAPLRYDGTTVATIASLGGTGTVPQGNCVLGAYGRLWVGDTATDKTVLSYSDLLIGQNWTGGSAGAIDLKSVWTNGADEIVAIGAQNGFLVVFGRTSILVYSNPSTPTSMALVEHIKGIGCVARDSIVNIANDILFLSNSGVRSLARSIQTNNMPLQDVSQYVRDDVVYSLSLETNPNAIKSVYHEPEGFYLLTFPTNNTTFYFDMRKVRTAVSSTTATAPADGQGSAPAFEWNGINPKALLSARDKTLYLGQAGVVGKYSGYTDNGMTYDLNYSTAWLSFDAPYTTKILKRIKTTVAGNINITFTVKWAYDYTGLYYTAQQTITNSAVAEYGIAEYGIAEYNSSIAINELSSPGQSAGKMLQVGLNATINGGAFAIQRFDVLVKKGRIR